MSEEGEEVPLSQPDLTPIKLTASTYIKYKDMDKEEFSVLYNGIKKKKGELKAKSIQPQLPQSSVKEQDTRVRKELDMGLRKYQRPMVVTLLSDLLDHWTEVSFPSLDDTTFYINGPPWFFQLIVSLFCVFIY